MKFSISVFSFSSSDYASASTISFFFLSLYPFITPVGVRGETLGHVSSSSHLPFTPAKIHNVVIVAG